MQKGKSSGDALPSSSMDTMCGYRLPNSMLVTLLSNVGVFSSTRAFQPGRWTGLHNSSDARRLFLSSPVRTQLVCGQILPPVTLQRNASQYLRAFGTSDDPLLNDQIDSVWSTAEEIAIEAGKLIKEKLGSHLELSSKAFRSDLVTQVDRESEDLIRRRIASSFPLHQVVGEEASSALQVSSLLGSATEGSSRDAGGAAGRADKEGSSGAALNSWVWVVDPLDGTLNFVAGMPLCAVSLGVALNGQLVAGAVFNPFSEELFSARRGEGAFLNGRRLQLVSGAAVELEDACVAVGFPSDPVERQRTLAALASVALQARTVRAHGSAPWDIAGARLILQEAGGRITSMDGSALPLSGGSVLATSGGLPLHSRLLVAFDSAGVAGP